MAFKKADRKQTFLRLALVGPAGSGKSYTALRLAHTLANGGEICAIDTERKTLSKYAGLTSEDGHVFRFDVEDEMVDCDVRRYINAIVTAENAGYKVMIIDSLSHAWAGPGGILEFVDNKKGGSANSSNAWREATPLHNRLVDTILSAKMHIIVTMRTKTEYTQEKDLTTNRVGIHKIGLQPLQRDGIDYEFDVICDMGDPAEAVTSMYVSKSRCPALRGGVFRSPGADVAQALLAWLSDGAVVQAPAKPATPPAAQPAAQTKGKATQTTKQPPAQPATQAPAKPAESAQVAQADQAPTDAPKTEAAPAEQATETIPATEQPAARVLPEQVVDQDKIDEISKAARQITQMYVDTFINAGWPTVEAEKERSKIRKEINQIVLAYCARSDDKKSIGSVPADQVIYQELVDHLGALAAGVSNQEVVPWSQ